MNVTTVRFVAAPVHVQQHRLRRSGDLGRDGVYEGPVTALAEVGNALDELHGPPLAGPAGVERRPILTEAGGRGEAPRRSRSGCLSGRSA